MPTINGDRLPYGQDALVPTDSPGAWGCRLIVTQDGHVDFLGDRQGCAGTESDRQRVLSELNQRFGIGKLEYAISERLRTRAMDTRKAEDFELFNDRILEVHANTNASAGYCYVTAWLKEAVRS